eukprot:TRINITY_DN18537_c0_g2_i2.p1 TRINITY_DN18537_c0_g2~~TRINITY_DN18537_c0_g2_i2.p1  ORF type:complete len:630 (-),score=156.47 TRINITY_DN18537_c0_g2_i2:32-1870(-)
MTAHWMRLVASAALAGVAAATFGADLEAAFKNFNERFDRFYAEDSDLKAKRFAAFKANYQRVEDSNAQGKGYTLEVNKFADLEPHEFRQMYLGLRVPKSVDLFGPKIGEHRVSAEALAAAPASVDWVSEGALGPVLSQGTCGSCWTFSTTAAVESAWKIASGCLLSLSQQELVDCSTQNSGCNGGWMPTAFEFMETVPLCSSESYPYTGSQGTCKSSTCKAAIPQGGVTGYKNVQEQSEAALRTALVQQPVSVAIDATEQLQMYKSGIFDASCATSLNHAVLAAGYGTEAGKGYWLIRNSWGTDWGENGYFRFLREADSTGPGQCGIQMAPSYPVVQENPTTTCGGGGDDDSGGDNGGGLVNMDTVKLIGAALAVLLAVLLVAWLARRYVSRSAAADVSSDSGESGGSSSDADASRPAKQPFFAGWARPSATPAPAPGAVAPTPTPGAAPWWRPQLVPAWAQVPAAAPKCDPFGPGVGGGAAGVPASAWLPAPAQLDSLQAPAGLPPAARQLATNAAGCDAIVRDTRKFDEGFTDLLSALRRDVRACPRENLASVPGKLQVWSFLVLVADKRPIYRRQVAEVANVLQADPQWARALAQHRPLAQRKQEVLGA